MAAQNGSGLRAAFFCYISHIPMTAGAQTVAATQHPVHNASAPRVRLSLGPTVIFIIGCFGFTPAIDPALQGEVGARTLR